MSLAIIGLNVEDCIQTCIGSVKGAYDELVYVDTGSTDKSIEAVLEIEPDVKIVRHEPEERHPDHGWLCDFSAARQESFDACTGDVIIWLDADDTLEHRANSDPARALRDMVEEFFERREPTVDLISLRYDYEKDSYGNVTVAQPRHRIMRKGYFDWVWPVHEDLKPNRFVKMAKFMDDPLYVDHHIKGNAATLSGERNLWIMQRYMDNGGEMNERLWSNFGGAYKTLGRHAEACEAFEKGIGFCTDNDEAMFIMLMRCGDSYRGQGLHRDAAAKYMQGMSLFPKRKQPYLAMAELMAEVDHPEEALHWCDQADRTAEEDHGSMWLPTSQISVPLTVRARSFMQTNRYREALICYTKLAELYPGNEQYAELKGMVGAVIEDHGTYQAFQVTAKAIDGDEFMLNAPTRFKTFPDVARAVRAGLRENTAGSRQRAVIYCGPSGSAWGPKGLEKGIGGSEEAVILLSRELLRTGMDVEVYAFPGADDVGQDEHGVCWYPYNAWDPEDEADVFIGWRQFRAGSCFHAGLAANCTKKYLWLHDKVDPVWFNQGWIDDLDGIFVLTEFHKAPLPENAKKKAILTRNGLDPAFFVDGENAINRFIFASSPDRGLVCLLEEWPKIREAVKDAQLDIYYGFTKQYLSEMQRFPHLKEIHDQVQELIKQDGVVWHGMVGHLELAHAFAASGFWLYPTAWPETSCITAMKAQALGAIPITSRFPESGVPETTKYDLGPEPVEGTIYDDPEWRGRWTASVIEAAVDSDHSAMREEMKEWARKTYRWQAVARQWVALFKAPSSEESNYQPKILAAKEGSEIQGVPT